MPDLDHEVHPSVRIGKEWRYGCWNLPRNRYGYWAAGRFIKDVMSKECRHDSSLSDPWCKGCKWAGTGEKYDQMIREQGK